MHYAQLNTDSTFNRELPAGNIEWDENNICTADALVRDGKADQFRVVPLAITEPPTHDPITQVVIRDGCELVDGRWQYKWRVDQLSPEQIEAVRKAAVPASASPRQIRQALTRIGLRSSVEAAVLAGDQDIKDWWEFSTVFERINPKVSDMGLALGVTELMLDDLWTLAGSL